jgi:hypothetical protein
MRYFKVKMTDWIAEGLACIFIGSVVIGIPILVILGLVLLSVRIFDLLIV